MCRNVLKEAFILPFYTPLGTTCAFITCAQTVRPARFHTCGRGEQALACLYHLYQLSSLIQTHLLQLAPKDNPNATSMSHQSNEYSSQVHHVWVHEQGEYLTLSQINCSTACCFYSGTLLLTQDRRISECVYVCASLRMCAGSHKKTIS